MVISGSGELEKKGSVQVSCDYIRRRNSDHRCLISQNHWLFIQSPLEAPAQMAIEIMRAYQYRTFK
jgi:hypothetical protein